MTIVMIGEQLGDREEKEGRPFVGPAGKFLDKCLVEAEIDRRKVYVTNTIKHFKWEPRGKLRIHKKPSMKEILACRPLAGSRIGNSAAEADRLPGRCGSSIFAWLQLQNHAGSRQITGG